MAYTRLFKRGNNFETNDFIGMEGEMTINKSDWSIHVHDGVTPGGHKCGGDPMIALLESADLLKDDDYVKDAVENYEKAKRELLLRLKLWLD